MPSPVTRALERVGAPLRGMSGLARGLAGVAAATLVFAGVAWMFRLGWTSSPVMTLLAWCIGGIVLVIGGGLARGAMTRLDARRLGEGLERSTSWRAGSVTGLIEPAAAGTSSALHAAAADTCAATILADGPAVLAPALHRQRRFGRYGVVVVIVAAVALVAARPATGVPAALWHPVGAWRALVAPVQLRAERNSVDPGQSAIFHLTALGHRRATLYTRTPGEAWRTTEVLLDSSGRASVRTPPLTADLLAHVEAGDRSSPDVRVAIRLAAFLGSFTVTARYPAYLGLQSEVLPATGDTLVLPEGTRLDLTGRATTPLSRAAMRGPVGDAALGVTGSTFRGELLPRESGTWRLMVTTANGGRLDGDVPAVPIQLVPDSAPVVDIPVPGADTLATTAMALPLVIGLRDDHGLSAAALELRRGNGGAVSRVPLTLPAGTADRALITASLDLTRLGLHPGDTLRYRATALDNAPHRHEGRSREYLLRIPTEAEERAARQQATGAAGSAFDSLDARATQLQRTEEDLARTRQRSDPANPATPGDAPPPDPLSNETARQASAVAQAQQQTINDATRLQQAVEQLRDAAERAGAADSALARQLDEIGQLLAKALSPELRDKLAALQQALKALDAGATQQSLQDLARQQAQLRDAIAQARELFKRAALETSLANLSQDAKAIAAEQHAASQQLSHPDSGQAAQHEATVARRTDSLAASLAHAAEQAPAQASRQALQQTAGQAQHAALAAQHAAEARQAGQQGVAEQDARNAQSQLDPLSKQIDDDRRSMQAEMRTEVKQALDRAVQETARLAQRQLDVVDAFQRGAVLAPTRDDEGVIAEGAAKLAQQVAAVSAMNALVSPRAGAALAEAQQAMRRAVEDVSTANPNARDAVEQSGDALDALGVAAFALLQSKDRVNGSQSGSGVQEAMQQMQQMAGQQGQLAGQSGQLMQQPGMSVQQLMQLALEQRALAQQLERMRAGGQLPGAGDLAREAKALSQALEQGRLNQDIVQRQQQLFKRMLDAGRTLQGEQDDDSKQRHATTAKDAPPAIPPALDPRIRNGTGDIRLPSWESLQRLSPDERRRVLDYFQRLAQSTSAGIRQP